MAEAGRYLFAGLSGAGNSIARGLENFEQLKKEDKVAKALFDALTPEDDPLTGETPAHPMRINKDAFNAMSAKDRIAATQGFMKATALQEATQELQIKRQALQSLAESENDLKAALQETVKTTAEEAKDIGPGAKPFNTQRFAQLIAEKYPAAARHPRLPQLLEMLNQSEAGGMPQILPGPYPGTKLVTDSRGRATPQIVTDPDVKAKMTKYQQAQVELKLGERIQQASEALSQAKSVSSLQLSGPQKEQYDKYFAAQIAAREEELAQAVSEYEEMTGKKFKAAKAEEPAVPSTGRITIKSIRQK